MEDSRSKVIGRGLLYCGTKDTWKGGRLYKEIGRTKMSPTVCLSLTRHKGYYFDHEKRHQKEESHTYVYSRVHEYTHEKTENLLIKFNNITTVTAGKTSSATLLRSMSSPPRWTRRVRCLDRPRSLSSLEVGEGSTTPPLGWKDPRRCRRVNVDIRVCSDVRGPGSFRRTGVSVITDEDDPP